MVLDRLTLNRTLLARQHLLERIARPPADEIEHLVGLQAQVPRDPYLALWSRLRDFHPAELERLLIERQIVRMTLMRTTIHLVTARDASTLRAVMQGVCERGFRSSPFARRLAGVDLNAVTTAGAEILTERPRTISDLGKVLATRWPDHDPEALAYAVRYLVPLVQVPPRGLWRRSGAPKVTTLEAWLGPSPRAPASSGADEIVLRYLRAFGPANAADIRTWSWLTNVRSVLLRLRPSLAIYLDEAGRELYDVRDGVFAATQELAPVRFLGEYDNVFLSHGDRSRVTGALRWGAGYIRRGAFFVDGFLAGSWRLLAGGRGPVLSIEPRTRLSPAAHRDATEEAEALYAFMVANAGSPRIAWATSES